MKRLSNLHLERYGSIWTTPRIEGILKKRRGQQLWGMLTKVEIYCPQSCERLFARRIDSWNIERWTRGYGIQHLRIGEIP